MMLSRFLELYPATNTSPVPQETIDKYKSILPESLIQLWQTHGFGKYNNGLIELIDPGQYEDTLALWLAKKVDTYIPIAISAFGDLFYYRQLTPTDEDVCCLDPHYRQINVTVWSLDDFFNEYLCDEEIIDVILRKELFDQAVQTQGALTNDEIYMFAPALALGGAEEIEYVSKGNGIVHLHLLFSMG